MKKIFLCLIAMTLPACSVLGEPAAEQIAGAVDKYCENEPFAQRQVYRDTINANTDGHTINVHCAGDPE